MQWVMDAMFEFLWILKTNMFDEFILYLIIISCKIM